MIALAAALAIAAAPAERVLDLGPPPDARASGDPVREIPFGPRADEELTGARLAIELAPGDDAAPLEVDVTVNDERIARLPAPRDGARVHELPIPPALLAPRNLLAVRLLTRRDGRCADAGGAWQAVRSMRLALQVAPVPLPDDLALLPLPFFDRGFDASAEVPLVVAAGEEPPAPERVRTAALVASWFAVDVPIPVDFAAAGALPDRSAIVLVAGAAEAARLGLPPPAGPSIRMTDHPTHPGANVKLLVVAGRDEGELRSAAEALAARAPRLAGPEMALAPVPPPAPAAPDSAPRWVPPGRAVRFAEYPGVASLAHDGTAPGTLSLRFRLAPDLWMWPADAVTLELGWAERRPPGAPPPRLDVELNGHFVATLPALPAGDARGRVRLRIPREHMRGFNELLVHVRSPDHDPCAPPGSPPAGGPRHVELAGDSRFRLEGLSRYASLPDVAAFVLDGYPFTLVPDLGEAAIVLPDRPAPQELSIALSAVGQLAQITGRTATRLTVLASGDAGDAALAGKDLLVVAARGRTPLLSRWSDRLPLSLAAPLAPRRPSPARAADLLGGLGPLLDLRRARAVAGAAPRAAAIAGIESPVTAGRTAVVVTAPAAADLPPWRQFRGYAESRGRRGDLLLAAGGRRWMFELGPSFGRGRLDRWTALRWALASHWIALVPLAVAGALALAREARRGLAARMRARLAVPPEVTP